MKTFRRGTTPQRPAVLEYREPLRVGAERTAARKHGNMLSRAVLSAREAPCPGGRSQRASPCCVWPAALRDDGVRVR